MDPGELSVRVLTVGNMYPPHHLGGYELVWRSAVEAMRRSGREVRVLTTDYRLQSAPSGPEPDVYRELRWYWKDHEFPRLTPAERLGLERHNAACLRRHLAELRPHVVAWWAMGGMSMSLIGQSRRAGLPAVAFVHDDWLLYGPLVDAWTRMFSRRPRARWLAERLTGIPARLDPADVDNWLFVSSSARDAALAAGWELPKTEIEHSGIDPSFLTAASDQEWRWRLLYVGRIDSRKGIDVAIEGLASMPSESRLTIVGDGDTREVDDLKARVRTLGLDDRVDFLGARPAAELRDLYAAADAVVFPVRWSEPWGLVPLESMAVERPVIATGRGGSGEYLRDGENCLLFDPDRPETLAAAISRLASEPQLRARLRQGGRATARRYTQDRFNAAALAAIEEAAARRAR